MSRTELKSEIDQIGARRLLLVCAVAERDLSQALADPLGDTLAAVFDDVRPHVPVAVAERAVKAAQDAAADGILAVGGGSTTGTAKAIALKLGLPIVAVPTTYAGSEMTPIWGMTDAGRKTTGRAIAVLPRLVVYDPELTLSLPVQMTAASAGNALAHCVEAFYAPGASPITQVLAEEGIRALTSGAPRATSAPTDLDGRTQMLYAAYLAGTVFAHAGSDIHHKLCHVLGGALDLPHAETHSVVLPYATAFVEASLPKYIQARLRSALGDANQSAAVSIQRFTTGLGLPASLQELGMPEDAITDLASAAVGQLPVTTPRPATSADIARILQRAHLGAPVEGV